MTEHREEVFAVVSEAASQHPVEPQEATAATVEQEVPAPAGLEPEVSNGAEARGWHAEAGRKGAHRVHQLIQEGKLYEQEHGLKSGRQRLRQLIELGKLYEQEHGLQPDQPRKPGERLSRMEREDL